MSAMNADIGVVGILKGVRIQVLRRDEELGAARGRERSMLLASQRNRNVDL